MGLRAKLARAYASAVATPSDGETMPALAVPTGADGDVRTSDEPARVMIVDDHALVRDAVRRSIEGPDIQIVGQASTGEEALTLVTEARPDLILLDIDLPGHTGIEIVEQLRRQAPDAQIVMLTVSTHEDDLHEAIRLGASGYLTKDMSSDALRRSVRGALAGDLAMPRRMARQLILRYATTAAPASEQAVGDRLTARENDILRLLSEGLTAREIGEVLVISPRTVEGHVGKILRKLGVRNRVEAVQRYRQRS